MGNYKIEINAVGGHGCQRGVGDGGTLVGCGSMSCPGCVTAEFVAKLARIGGLQSAAFIHWPGEPMQVTDQFNVAPSTLVGNRATRTRVGSF